MEERTEEAGGAAREANPEPEQSPNVLARIFGPADEGEDLHRSGFVALVGRPNVGKSTILNALVGEKVAIVSDRPQTTRRRVLGILTTEHAQAIFVDTPGIHRPKSSLGRYMVREARGAVPDADVVVWVVDVSRPPGGMDRSVAGSLRDAERPVVLALNKSDRLKPEYVKENVEAYRALAGGTEDWTLTIATRDHNLDRLWQLIASRLPEGPPLYPEDQLTDQTDRMLVAELIREAALKHLYQEVPHGLEVLVEDWDELPDGTLGVAAQIWVERATHKGIVIGKRGAMLKRIGTDARREIEQLIGRHVYLDLFVAVRDDWRSDERHLRELGFE